MEILSVLLGLQLVSYEKQKTYNENNSETKETKKLITWIYKREELLGIYDRKLESMALNQQNIQNQQNTTPEIQSGVSGKSTSTNNPYFSSLPIANNNNMTRSLQSSKLTDDLMIENLSNSSINSDQTLDVETFTEMDENERPYYNTFFEIGPEMAATNQSNKLQRDSGYMDSSGNLTNVLEQDKENEDPEENRKFEKSGSLLKTPEMSPDKLHCNNNNNQIKGRQYFSASSKKCYQKNPESTPSPLKELYKMSPLAKENSTPRRMEKIRHMLNISKSPNSRITRENINNSSPLKKLSVICPEILDAYVFGRMQYFRNKDEKVMKRLDL